MNKFEKFEISPNWTSFDLMYKKGQPNGLWFMWLKCEQDGEVVYSIPFGDGTALSISKAQLETILNHHWKKCWKMDKPKQQKYVKGLIKRLDEICRLKETDLTQDQVGKLWGESWGIIVCLSFMGAIPLEQDGYGICVGDPTITLH